jgi:cytochrome c553
MKRCTVVILLVMAIALPVCAAETQSDASAGRDGSYPPRLAVVMELIQLSHFKLWLAGNLKNWRLAEYELTQMKATLQDAKTLFPDLPGADTSAISQSADEFVDAIRAKDAAKFESAFKKFTSECNSCHERRGLQFIRIKVPSTSPIMTSPLSDQLFAPE